MKANSVLNREKSVPDVVTQLNNYIQFVNENIIFAEAKWICDANAYFVYCLSCRQIEIVNFSLDFVVRGKFMIFVSSFSQQFNYKRTKSMTFGYCSDDVMARLHCAWVSVIADKQLRCQNILIFICQMKLPFA